MGAKQRYANRYTAFLQGERPVDKVEKDRQDKSFPHIPQVFPQETKIGGLYI
jgi:hypothetical protein